MLDAGDSELEKTLSLPSKKLEFREIEEVVNAIGNAVKCEK